MTRDHDLLGLFGCTGVPFEAKFASGGSNPGSFEGYGAVFGNIDAHGDVVEPGAFAKSLLDRQREGRALPPMYKMHGAIMGNRHEPVGVWDAMSEDTNGLHVKGRLIGLETEQGKWNYAQLREGGLNGLSIGYKILPGGSRKGTGKAGEPARWIKSAFLREVSLVDDPSNALSRVYAVKRMWGDEAPAEGIKTIREFEEFLRDAGFSKAAAGILAQRGWSALPTQEDDEQSNQIADLVASIRRAKTDVRGK